MTIESTIIFSLANPIDIMFMAINNITFPYDMKGVASMMWWDGQDLRCLCRGVGWTDPTDEIFHGFLDKNPFFSY